MHSSKICVFYEFDFPTQWDEPYLTCLLTANVRPYFQYIFCLGEADYCGLTYDKAYDVISEQLDDLKKKMENIEKEKVKLEEKIEERKPEKIEEKI